jgi:hypothetical protein
MGFMGYDAMLTHGHHTGNSARLRSVGSAADGGRDLQGSPIGPNLSLVLDVELLLRSFHLGFETRVFALFRQMST